MHTLNLRSFLWFATGVALTITAVATFGTWRADAGGAPAVGDTTFVPIAPCRLFDTRPGEEVPGSNPTPLQPETDRQVQVTGFVGFCNIPADASGVAMNVTILNPSAAGVLTVFPANLTTKPSASNLNWVAGQAPTPNKVDVQLSPAGAVKLGNGGGTVDVLADVVGYYRTTRLSVLEARLTAAETALTAQAASVQQNADDILDASMDIDALQANVIHTFVGSDGAPFASRRVVSTSRVSTGSYTVTVDRVTEGCIPSATAFDFQRIVAIDGFDRTGSDFNIDVQDVNGDPADGGFWFLLVCPA